MDSSIYKFVAIKSPPATERELMDWPGINASNSIPLTPLGFLDRTSIVYGDNTSIVYNDSVFTWSETRLRCIRLASALSAVGIKPGDVVSVLAPNIPAMYEMHFGVPMSGAILNTINTRLDPRTISILLRHCCSKLVFVDILSSRLLKEALCLLPDDHPHPLVIPIEDPYIKEIEANIVKYTNSGLTYNNLIEKGDPEYQWMRPNSEWEPMILNYTSGTTSAPKGVVHSHRGIYLATIDSLIEWSVPKHPVYLWTVPMFHTNGWSFPWGIAAAGGTNICLRRFDAATIYAAIEVHRVTHMCGAPVVLNMLSHAQTSERRPLPGIVHILTAGAPPPAAILHRIEEIGFTVSHGYGLTETAGVSVSCTWKRQWDRLPDWERARLKARQGVRVLGMAAVDVIDISTGQSVPHDGTSLGEVVMRGGSVMLGYLKDEAATTKALRGGWFYTGDIGVMHPDGYLEIKDRSKDVIISGGENLSSVEVESVLYEHPSVNEVAVVARPDDYWGETPCAFIRLKTNNSEGQMSSSEIMAWCRKRMPHYMVPKTVIFKSELPKTSTGKIQKFVLREIAKELGSLTKSRM